MKQKRVYAFLIDLLIIAIPALLLMDVGVFVLKSDFETFLVPASVLAILMLLLKDFFGGRSPGKYFMGLRIMSVQKSALVLRNLPLILLPLEALFFLLSSKRLGDTLFKTEVVTDEQGSSRQNTVFIAGVFISLLFVYMSLRSLVGLYIRQKQEYLLTEAFVFGSKAIKEKTGEIIEMSKVPTYNINNHEGHTYVSIETKVYGRKENANLTIYLEKKEGGEWAVTDYKYEKE